MTNIFIRFANIILAALLAGTSFGIWMGFNPINYSASTYLEQQLNLVRSLHILMVSLVIIATIVTLISAFLQRKNKTVFITLLFAAGEFAIYPNPADDWIYVRTDSDLSTFEIVNYLGQIVFSKELEKGSQVISIDKIMQGVYLYKLRSEDGENETGKLIIAK